MRPSSPQTNDETNPERNNMTTTPKPKVVTTAILTARNFETKTTVKCGAILENEDGSEFILLNHLLNYNDFVDHKRVANGHIKINIIAKEDWNE